jgi:hypothetical protein
MRGETRMGGSIVYLDSALNFNPNGSVSQYAGRSTDQIHVKSHSTIDVAITATDKRTPEPTVKKQSRSPIAKVQTIIRGSHNVDKI